MKIEMSGYADVRADARTVKDLRDLVSFLDENRVRDDAQIDWGSGFVYILVADNSHAEFIECGEHIPPDREFDVLLNTHPHATDDDDDDVKCDKCFREASDSTYHFHHGSLLCRDCYRKQLPETYEEALEMALDG